MNDLALRPVNGLALGDGGSATCNVLTRTTRRADVLVADVGKIRNGADLQSSRCSN